MARSPLPGLWWTQGFIAVLLALLVCRYLAAPEVSPPDPRERRSSDGSKPGRPKLPPPGTRPAQGDLQPPGPGRDSREAAASGFHGSARSSVEGAPYAPEQYGTHLVTDEPFQKVWCLDRRELTWMRDNRRGVLTADLRVCPEPAGGLRISEIREGSFAAARGLRVGDVLVDINGRVLEAASDLEDFVEDVSAWASGGWRITLERENSTVLLDYRPSIDAGSKRREH